MTKIHKISWKVTIKVSYVANIRLDLLRASINKYFKVSFHPLTPVPHKWIDISNYKWVMHFKIQLLESNDYNDARLYESKCRNRKQI